MILKNGKRIDGCSDTVPIGTVNPFLGAVAPFGYLLLQGQKVSKITYPELYEICGTTFGPETSTEFTLPDLRGQTIAGYKEGDPTFGTLGGLIGALTKSYTPAGKNTGTAVTLNAVELTHSGGAVQSHTLTAAESGLPAHQHGGLFLDGTEVGISNGSSSGYGQGISSGNRGTKYYTGYNTEHDATSGHTHGFTQPSKHSFTPTTKSITQPTFTGTSKDINVVQPTITLNWIVKAVMLIPNQSTVVNADSDSSVNVYSCDYMNDLLEQMKQEAFNFAHPVGSYYETSDSTWTPQAAGWYGTWVADNDGSALVSYKSSGAFNKATGTIVGGESQSYTPAGTNTGGSVGNHTLTASESGVPAHSHGGTTGTGYTTFLRAVGAAGTSVAHNHTTGYSSSGYTDCNNTGTFPGANHTHDFTTNNNTAKSATSGHNHGFTQPTFTGTAATLSTIQTSKVVYRWHRTA